MCSLLAHIMLCGLISSILCVQSCNSPTCTPSITMCNNGNCQCNPNRIYNCVTLASALPVGSNTIVVQNGSSNYYILDNTMDENLQYYMTLKDSSNANMQTSYDLTFDIDNGIGSALGSPSGTVQYTDNLIQLLFTTRLQKIQGTQIPQQLILNVTYNNLNNSTLIIQYQYSIDNWSKILLIMAYVAGGILLVTTIVMIVLIIRRNRRDDQEMRERRDHQEREKNNIQHFDALMPITTITVQEKKDAAACAVCLTEFDFNSEVRKTICGHTFHSACIDEWCHKNITCPNCRTSLEHHHIVELKNQKSKNDTSSWVVNSIEYSDDQEGEGESARQMGQGDVLVEVRDGIRQPLNRSQLGNSQL